MSKTDTYPAHGVTLRTHTDENGAATRWDVFLTGWRLGSYKTETGAQRGVDRAIKLMQADA